MTVLAMIGAGCWGYNWVRTLASMPKVRLRWVCDSNPTTLERIGRQYSSLLTTTSVGRVLTDPVVEGVIVATPVPSHAALARQALEANKHVLVEKPLTLRSEEAVALTGLAQQQRRLLMVGHLLDYHPALTQLKRMIDGGELGEIHYLYSQRLNLGTIRADEDAWWSLAPHDISVACRLLDARPTGIQCRGQNVVRSEIADVIFATLEFPGHRLAHIHVSWLDPHKTRKLTVVGSRRMAVFDDTLPAYKVMIYDKGFERNESFGSYADWISMRQGDITIPKHDVTEPLLVEAEHFVDCIRAGRLPLSDGAAGTMVVRVLEQGQRSLDEGGKPVALSWADSPAPNAVTAAIAPDACSVAEKQGRLKPQGLSAAPKKRLLKEVG